MNLPEWLRTDGLIFQLDLDLLDDYEATYSGPQKSIAVIDKATWIAQGRPSTVFIVVPYVEGTVS